MSLARPLLVATAALTLLAAACSTPDDLNAPSLDSQFGSARDDYASVVTTDAQRGHIFVAGTQESPYDNSGEKRTGDVVFFSRYDNNGHLIWTKNANTKVKGAFATAVAADADAKGNIFFAWSIAQTTAHPAVQTYRSFISKYSPSGTRLFRKELSNEDIKGLATDTSGNLYVTVSDYMYDTPLSIRKYTNGGKLVWSKVVQEKDFPEGVALAGLDVATDGSVFVAAAYASNGAALVKLRGSDGKFLKASRVGGDFASDVEVVGGAVYVYSVLDSPFSYEPIVSRFRTDGSRMWEQRGDFESDDTYDNLRYDYATGGISADPQGNVYLAGTFVVDNDDGNDNNILIRKYTPAGGVAYNRRFIDPETLASGLGVAAVSSSELYLVGTADTIVNGKNNGGNDAFVWRLNAQGQKVWIR